MTFQEFLAILSSPWCSVNAMISSAVQVSGCIPELGMVQPGVSCTVSSLGYGDYSTPQLPPAWAHKKDHTHIL